MKRRWIVKWYDLNLTQEMSRKFFTEVGANFYAWYLEYNGTKTWTYYDSYSN